MPLSPRSPNALIGGLPTPQTDVPICAVFIPIFLLGSLLNATLFFRNLRRKHKFIPSWLLNVFCLIRIVTCSTRIAWAKDPTNASLAVAAQVFNNAGVIFLYIINLLFAQRILRALQPGVGWNKGASVLVKGVFAGVVASLVMGITGLVISVNTHNPDTLRSIRDIGLATSTYIVVVTILPFVFLGLAYGLPASPEAENFGTGSMRAKTRVLLVSCFLATVIAGFKAGTTWERPRAATDPAWYDAKAAFYCFGFVLEVSIVALLTAARVDRMFFVQNGCKGPGDYSRPVEEGSESEGTGELAKEEGIALGKL
ncbi:family c-likeg- -coupled receptor protein [Rutstroemia sp. NJR-2017a WRK4]|nr:family c-likeg- -coupled receptor protein [Rutstroemia sp. NJR-2017a WRK4]